MTTLECRSAFAEVSAFTKVTADRTDGAIKWGGYFYLRYDVFLQVVVVTDSMCG